MVVCISDRGDRTGLYPRKRGKEIVIETLSRELGREGDERS